jgi:hypothetical protein
MKIQMVAAMLCFALLSPRLYGETFVQADVSSRLVLAYRANPDAVQRFLPAPWRLNPLAQARIKGQTCSSCSSIGLSIWMRMANLFPVGPIVNLVIAAPATNLPPVSLVHSPFESLRRTARQSPGRIRSRSSRP